MVDNVWCHFNHKNDMYNVQIYKRNNDKKETDKLRNYSYHLKFLAFYVFPD